MKILLGAVLLILSLAPAIAAGSMGMSMQPPPTQTPGQLQPGSDTEIDRRRETLHAELLALREEGLKLRQSDGGTLTPEHRAYLQKKLDDLNARARALR